jgi:hypothetical protein
MSMSSPVLNALSLMGGVLPKVERGIYIAAGAAPSAGFVDFGAVVGFTLHHKQTSKVIEADNCLEDLAAYLTKNEITVEFQTLEVGLKNMAEAMGYLSTDVLDSSGQTLPVKPVTAHNEWQLRITAPNVMLQPVGAGGDVYTERVHTLWRCFMTTDLPIKLGRGDHVAFKWTYRVLLDTTVTPTTSVDQLGSVQDIITP